MKVETTDADPADRSPRTCNALASTIGLSATILDRAGLHPYHGLQGVSLLSALQNGKGVRDSLLIEYNDGGRRMGFAEPARMRAVITNEWHLAVYKGEEWGKLYDRRNDPKHLHNLWNQPSSAGIKADLILALTHHLIAQTDESPRSQRLA